MLHPMADDAVAQAREILQHARDATSQGGAQAVLEALDQIARKLDRLSELERNLAIQQALLDERLLRVERNRLFTAFNRVVSAGASLLQRVRTGLPNRIAEEEEDPAEYTRWVAHESAALPSADAARAIAKNWPYRPAISVLLTIRAGETAAECLESLRGQAYDNYEICVAANRTCELQLAGPRERIRAVPADDLDDVQAMNAAAEQAAGEYVAVMANPGVLSPMALYYAVEALQQGPFDVVYCDEDSLDGEGRRVNPKFKPDWSPELLTSTMYLGSLLIVRKESWLRAHGLSTEVGDAYLHDLVLRLADGTVRVHHIRRVLHHGLRAVTAPHDGGQAIARAVERRERVAAKCSSGPSVGTWIARRQRVTEGMTAIICSRSPALLERCLESVRRTAQAVVRQVIVVAHEESGPSGALRDVAQRAGAAVVSYTGAFHFAAMNNLAAERAEGSNLLFLNDDVRATEGDWAELLAEQVARQEVGVAGAVLWYPTGVVQHAGIVAGIGDGVGHVGRHQRASRLWPWLLATRDVSAVTGACLAIRRELFHQLGGFDQLFPNNYNDVDLCFRVRAQGYRVICVPVPGLVHAECQSRPGVVRFEERFRFYTRWAAMLRSPDPYYSRSLAAGEKIVLNLSGEDWYRGLGDEGR